MNKSTLEKLKQNPHYKMSEKQRKKMEEEEREPMIEFGEANIHNHNIPIHQTQKSPLKRRSRKMLE